MRAHRLHSPMVIYFDAIRRAGSIREAARRLNVASSAVNRQLLKLEAELGTQLFERLPNGLKLTHAGAIYARHAIEVIQDAERVRTDLEALQGIRIGHVELGAIESMTSSLLPKVVTDARRKYPGVSIGVTIMGSAAIPAALASGDIDLGIAFGIERSPELQQLSSARFALGAVMRSDHPLAGEKTISVAKCRSQTLILPKSDLSIRQTLAQLLPNLTKSYIESNSMELAKRLTLQGLGISFQTKVGIEQELERNELVHLPLSTPAPVMQELGVYVRAARNPPISVNVFAQFFSDEINRVASA